MRNLDNITNSQINAAIEEYCHSKRDRELLKSRYIDGLTYEALAEQYDLSVTQTKRIVYKEGDRVLNKISGAVF